MINTRPAISFYNDNNPDWLNVMIFYHVLGHIDFFQNNLYFRHTWDDDFTGQALADKRAIAKLRSEKGRWVDYVIEFARSLDNLVDYHGLLAELQPPGRRPRSRRASTTTSTSSCRTRRRSASATTSRRSSASTTPAAATAPPGEDEFFKRRAARATPSSAPCSRRPTGRAAAAAAT